MFLSANPHDTDQLRLISECNNIDEKLKSTPHGRDFQLVQRHEVQLTRLQGHLLDLKPQVVHFSGHGSIQGQLVFQNDSGFAQEASIESVANLFRILNESGTSEEEKIRVVVLNACYSEKQAAAIAKYVDCVVGMSTEVTDESARKFAEAFYRALGHDRNVESAYDLACNQLGLEGLPEDKTPKLKSKRGVNPSEVTLLSTIKSAPKEIKRTSPTKLLVFIGIALAAAASIAIAMANGGGSAVALEVNLNGPVDANVNEPVQFVADVKGGSGNYEYVWDFGTEEAARRGAGSEGHVYVNEGQYEIRVRVKDLNANSNYFSDTKQVKILASLEARIIGPTNVRVADDYQWRAEPVGGLEPYSYNWGFDSSFIQTAPPDSVATGYFSESGDRTIQLTVNDKGGNAVTKSIEVRVIPTVTISRHCIDTDGTLHVALKNENNSAVTGITFWSGGNGLNTVNTLIGANQEEPFTWSGMLSGVQPGDNYDGTQLRIGATIDGKFFYNYHVLYGKVVGDVPIGSQQVSGCTFGTMVQILN